MTIETREARSSHHFAPQQDTECRILLTAVAIVVFRSFFVLLNGTKLCVDGVRQFQSLEFGGGRRRVESREHTEIGRCQVESREHSWWRSLSSSKKEHYQITVKT